MTAERFPVHSNRQVLNSRDSRSKTTRSSHGATSSGGLQSNIRRHQNLSSTRIDLFIVLVAPSGLLTVSLRPPLCRSTTSTSITTTIKQPHRICGFFTRMESSTSDRAPARSTTSYFSLPREFRFNVIRCLVKAERNDLRWLSTCWEFYRDYHTCMLEEMRDEGLLEDMDGETTSNPDAVEATGT